MVKVEIMSENQIQYLLGRLEQIAHLHSQLKYNPTDLNKFSQNPLDSSDVALNALLLENFLKDPNNLNIDEIDYLYDKLRAVFEFSDDNTEKAKFYFMRIFEVNVISRLRAITEYCKEFSLHYPLDKHFFTFHKLNFEIYGKISVGENRRTFNKLDPGLKTTELFVIQICGLNRDNLFFQHDSQQRKRAIKKSVHLAKRSNIDRLTFCPGYVHSSTGLYDYLIQLGFEEENGVLTYKLRSNHTPT